MQQQKPYTPKNKVRIVTAASLFDGHDAAINIMRRIIQSTGVEVIHLGHDRSVEEVVNTAIQEDGMKNGKGAWDFTEGLALAPNTLLIASGNNTVLGEAFQQRQRAFFSDTELIVIPDSGHEVPKTHPQETLDAIFSYLTELNL